MSGLLELIGYYTYFTDGGNAIVVILSLLAIIYGITSCFFGYRIFKYIVGVCGFIVGVFVGLVFIMASNGIDASGPAVLVSCILGGILGALLAIKVYYAAVFLIGGLFGGLLGFTITLGLNGDNQGIVILIMAIIAGILAIMIKKFMIILSTSVSGAQSASMAVIIILYVASGNDYAKLYNVLWIILAITGFCYQYSKDKRVPVNSNEYTRSDISGSRHSTAEYSTVVNIEKYKKTVIAAGIILLVLILLNPKLMIFPILVTISISLAVYFYVTGKSKNAVVGIICPSCRTLNKSSNSFCINCGADLKGKTPNNVQRLECPMCKSLVNANNKYCTNCGYKLIKDENENVYEQTQNVLAESSVAVAKDSAAENSLHINNMGKEE